MGNQERLNGDLDEALRLGQELDLLAAGCARWLAAWDDLPGYLRSARDLALKKMIGEEGLRQRASEMLGQLGPFLRAADTSSLLPRTSRT